MQITVQPFTLPALTQSVCYLAKVKKATGEWDEYVIDISFLPQQFYPIFKDAYDLSTLQNDFYLVNFYTLSTIMEGSPLYEVQTSMKFSWNELQEFMVNAVGTALMDFISRHAPHALVAIPVRPGLSKLYEKVLDENEQKLGYNCIRRYREWGMYVIEI